MEDDAYPSEAELAAGLGREEPEAMVAFARRYGPRIDGVLRRLHIGAGDRDELVVKVTRSVVHQATQQTIHRLGAYTVTAAMNAGRSLLRSRRHLRQVGWERVERLERLGPARRRGSPMEGLAQHAAWVELEATAAGRMAGRNRQAARLARAALATLPEADRRLLLLRAEEFEYEEVACFLGDGEEPLKLPALRQRHRRALGRFRKAYNRLADAEPVEVRRELQACGMRSMTE